MLSNYESVYFANTELLPPEYALIMSEQHQNALIPAEVKRSLDFLRALHGYPIIINNWKSGGAFRYSGLRPLDCPEGAEFSRHKGYSERQAFDIKTQNLNGALELIKAHYRILCIGFIEEPGYTIPKGYLHIEFVNEQPKTLKVFQVV